MILHKLALTYINLHLLVSTKFEENLNLAEKEVMTYKQRKVVREILLSECKDGHIRHAMRTHNSGECRKQDN